MVQEMTLRSILDGEVSLKNLLTVILGDEGPWARTLKELVSSLINAEEELLSLWDVNIKGDVYVIDGAKKKQIASGEH